MKAQIINRGGKPEYAIIPYHDYLRLQELVSGEEGGCHDEACDTRAAGERFAVPAYIVRRESAGESVVKLWRVHRGLTQQELAESIGVSKPYISQIETGKRQGSHETLAAIAEVLEVPLRVVLQNQRSQMQQLPL